MSDAGHDLKSSIKQIGTVTSQFLTSFEGREAIYVEKGALRVRVSNILFDSVEQMLTADIEEIASVGLGFVMANRPSRWSTGTTDWAGPSLSNRRWSGGAYVGWTLYLDRAAYD